MFGSHLSVAGGLHNALIEAQRLDMDCVQVFTKNQRQWRAAPLSEESIREWNQHRKETEMDQVVSHDSYLINLAHSGEEPWRKSVEAFRDELQRCEMLAIPYLVTHPGAHLGEGIDAGIERVAAALNLLHRDLAGYRTVTLLEVTAGQGTCLGAKFEEIKQIIDRVTDSERVAVCLDTAHMIEAGYDLTSAEGTLATLDELDAVISLARVKAIHINDSKTPRGSRVDRHEHIGKGHVSLEAFRSFVNHPAFQNVPMILETPKEEASNGELWDVINLRVLRDLQKTERKTGRSRAK
ncbi:MAG: deoxyribonuclease IV [Phycisphaeraceae bacterium]|nr:deoxyribonuclease IV [Phycisphaeraceae bacterium]